MNYGCLTPLTINKRVRSTTSQDKLLEKKIYHLTLKKKVKSHFWIGLTHNNHCSTLKKLKLLRSFIKDKKCTVHHRKPECLKFVQERNRNRNWLLRIDDLNCTWCLTHQKMGKCNKARQQELLLGTKKQ